MSHHDGWRRERRVEAARKRLVMPAVTLFRAVAVAWSDVPGRRPLHDRHFERRRRASHPDRRAAI